MPELLTLKVRLVEMLHGSYRQQTESGSTQTQMMDVVALA